MINSKAQVTQRTLDFDAVVKQINASKKVLIFVPQNPSVDAVASALALYLSLKKQKKSATIACSNPLTVSFNRLYAVNKVVQSVGNKNMVISFACPEDTLEKVSYSIDNSVFNLVLERKDGYAPLKSNDVSYNYTGVSADLVVVVGASKIEDIGSLYTQETSFFTQAQVVNISNSVRGVLFGRSNIFDSQTSSCAELMAELLKRANLPLDADLATNLLAGIETATNNLAFKTTGKTFEILSWLMSAGARRGHMGTSARPQGGVSSFGGVRPPSFGANISRSTPQYMPNPAMPTQGQVNPVNPAVPPTQYPTPTGGQNQGLVSNQRTQAPLENKGSKQFDKVVKASDVEKMPAGTEPAKESAPPAAPKPDWFKPKIYKGKTRV